jgi:sugar lactone lactonase YvrE
MHRRAFLWSLLALIGVARIRAASSVATLVGTGTPGLSDTQVNNPYGIVMGPDGGLYFCDLDNQMIRRFDPVTKTMRIVAGNGVKGRTGDGGPATEASLNMPHEIQFDVNGNCYIAERDNHIVRKVDPRGTISTLAGTGVAGFVGDGGLANAAALNQPHSIAIGKDNQLLICDIGNQRIRRVDLSSGRIDTYAGTGVAQPTPDGASVMGTPLQGPRTMVFDAAGDAYLALREGNAIYRLDTARQTWHHIAGTGKQGYTGDGGLATVATLAGPKGLAWSPGRLFVADTENHVIRQIDLTSGIITTILGTGQRGDGPESEPLACRLSRPHGLFVDRVGMLYVTDSEAHRIRVMSVLG